MGTPSPGTYTEAMFDFAGTLIAGLVREHVPTDRKLLDIGPGWGKYRWLLPEYEFDGVEAWEPYVHQHRLDAFYDTMHILDVTNFSYPQRYGAVIFGDVLEHISVEGAQRAIRDARAHADHVLVAVPFEMIQGAEEGNHHEIHLQDDLNAELMAERYPELVFHSIFQRQYEHAKAVYVSRD